MKRLIKKVNRQVNKLITTPSNVDFLILGAQKAATTSIFSYLMNHPNIQGALNKEVGFFSNDKNYEKGKDWYNQFFRSRLLTNDKLLHFEATPEYLYYPFVPKRIKAYSTNLKFIIILREPISRAYSSWNMYHRFLATKDPVFFKDFGRSALGGQKNNVKTIYNPDGNIKSFEALVRRELTIIEKNEVDDIEPSFIRRGIYVEQLKRYFDTFDRSQFLILPFGEVTKNTESTLNKITEFLGLPVYDWSRHIQGRKNVGQYKKGGMEETLKKELKNFYAPYNKQLFDLLDEKWTW